jgi:hypothetical protein
MEFKGTKGNWKISTDNEMGTLITSTHPQNRDIATIWKYDATFLENREAKANALLISKAPEMLEMLKKVLIHVDWSYETWTSNHGLIIEEEIKELIKEATEL